MALLGLFVAAPSVMAGLQDWVNPGRLAGIMLKENGPAVWSSYQSRQLHNGVGLWLQNIGAYQIVKSEADIDHRITISIDKLNQSNPLTPNCANPKNANCILDITDESHWVYVNGGTKVVIPVKLYAKYTQNGVTQNNPYLNEQGFLVNLWSHMFGTVIYGGGNASTVISDATFQNPIYQACEFNQQLWAYGVSRFTCHSIDMYSEGVRSDGHIGIIEATRYDKNGVRKTREFGRNHAEPGLYSGNRAIVHFKSISGSDYYVIESAKWVLENGRMATLNKSRIQVVDGSPSCYENLDGRAPAIAVNFWTSEEGVIWGSPYGAVGAYSPVTKLSWSYGDALMAGYPSTPCSSFLGFAANIDR